MSEQDYTNWLPDTDYQKLFTQTNTSIGSLLYLMDKHGMGILIPGIHKEIMNIVERSWKVIRGKNVPIAPPDHVVRSLDKYNADD